MESITAHLCKDKKLAKAIRATSLKKLRKEKDIYVVLLRSIVGQQLSTKAAATIWDRFVKLFPDEYPHPKKVLKLSDEKMRGCGLSGQKAGYIRNIARFDAQYPDLDKKLAKMSDEEVVEFLSQIKGVGKWTVEMILMFAMARTDILPVDDLGIRQGMQMLFGLTSEGKQLSKDMIKTAEKWRPYRTYACMAIWRYKDAQKSL